MGRMIILCLLHTIIGGCAIASAACDEVALSRCSAYAAATATERRAAALRLALIVLEHEEIVRSRGELLRTAYKSLIRSRIAPCAHAIIRGQFHTIKRANRFIFSLRATSLVQEIRSKALATGSGGRANH